MKSNINKLRQLIKLLNCLGLSSFFWTICRVTFSENVDIITWSPPLKLVIFILNSKGNQYMFWFKTKMLYFNWAMNSTILLFQ